MPLAPRRSSLLLAGLLSGAFATAAVAGPQEDARARNAVRVLTEFQAVPENAIPDKLLDEAHALVIVPDTIKAGLVVGGRRGRGLLSVKGADGTWSNPAFVTLTGGSIGFQAGVQSSDIVLAFRSPRGLDSIVNGKFTLGADAGVAAGPVGRAAATATDGELKAEIWSWSRARGLFAGVALDGAVLSIDDAANEAVYGRDTTPRMIFEGRAAQAPSGDIVAFRDQLEEASAAARSHRDRPVAGGPRTVARPPAPAQPAATATTADLAGQMFEPVQDTPATTEPLPPTP